MGIVIAYLTNYVVVGIPHDWQWMLGIEAVPALCFALLLMTVPESPRWLVKCGIINKARDILIQIGEPDVEKELAAIQKSLKR